MLDTIAMAAQLEGEYKTIFEKADMYGTLEKCSDENIRDDKMMNLYDLLLQAQIDKTPVSKIIGEDIEEFCKSYFKEEAEKTSKWIGVAKIIYNIAWWGVIAGLLEVLLPEEEGGFGSFLEVDIMPIIVGSLLGFGLGFPIWVAKKTVLKSKKLKPIALYFLLLFVFAISVVATGVISVKIGIEWNVKAGNLLIFSGLYVVIYLLLRGIWRYRDHGTITRYSKEEKRRRKEEKEEKEAFNKDVSKRNVAQTAKDMKSRYKRLSRRHEKKYAKPMTLQQYKEKLNKELKSLDRNWIFYLVMDALLVLGPTIHIMVTDGLTVAVICVVIMVVAFFFVNRFQKWIDNISKDAYYEMLYVLDLCLTYDLNLDTVGEAVESGKITLDSTSQP